MVKRPRVAFPLVPGNPFWPPTHAEAWPSYNWLDVQSGNAGMKRFVCGIPHEEDQKPAAWLVCPQDSGDASALPPASSSALLGHPDRLPKVLHLHSRPEEHQGQVQPVT